MQQLGHRLELEGKNIQEIVRPSSFLGMYSTRPNEYIRFDKHLASNSERIGAEVLATLSSMTCFFSKLMPAIRLCRLRCKSLVAAFCPRDSTCFITFAELRAIVALCNHTPQYFQILLHTDFGTFVFFPPF